MKKRLFISICIVCLIFLCASANAKKFKFNYASNVPQNTLRGQMETFYIEELESLSDGRIEVQTFWSNTLADLKEILQAVKSGLADIGAINCAFYPNRLLFSNGIMLAEEGPKKSKHMINTYNEIFSTIPEIRNEYLKYNQRIVYVYAGTPYSFSSKKYLSDVEDLNGLKARASSRWKMNNFKELGAIPVSVSWSDCYMALQTGTVDTVMTNVDAQHRGKLYEVAPNLWIWENLWLGVPYIITMNEDTYNDLPKDLQQVVEQARVNAQKRANTYYAEAKKKAIENMKAAGTKITYADDTDYEKWLSLPSIKENVDTWVKEAKKEGAEEPREIYSNIMSIIEKYIEKEK